MLAPGRDKSRRGAAPNADQARNGAASRFEVLERVGQSTLWIVYRAKDRNTGQLLALKALKGAFNRHPRFVESLYESGEHLLDLSHPNVVTLQEIGREEGTLYQAVDWISGGSLETRLLRAPLNRKEILSMLVPTVSGLAYLHEQGIIHGDLRPRQILNDGQDEWKIGDLGASQAFAAAGMATADAQPEAAYYLAPERTLGAAPSPASDIYSVGVILYRMLTGRVPFDGPSPLAIALRHRSDAPLTPTQLNPRADGELAALALRLLDKVPENRPTTPTLLNILEKMAGGAVVRTPSPATVATPVPAPATTPPAVTAAVPTPSPVPTPKRRQPPVLEPDPDTAAAPPPVVDLATVKRRHVWREFWGMFTAFLFLLIALCIFAGVFVGAYFYWVRDTPPEVQVPNYVNLNQDDAQKALLKKGLTLRVGREIYDPKKAAGTVIEGEPEPGKWVRARREVVVTVSQGEKPTQMYDFEGLTLEQARKIITKHGMRLGQIIEQYHDKEPQGYICGQYPEAGQSFRRREPITLVVSRGPQPKELDPNQDPLAGVPAPDADPLGEATAPPFSTEPINPAATPEPSGGAEAKVVRAVVIRVGVPADGPRERVRIVVRDDSGERTVYSRQHNPGDVIGRTVRVTRSQNSKALIRVYVGDQLVKEQSL